MPDITFDTSLFGNAFLTVLVIMDPMGNVPIFLAITRGQTTKQRNRSALLGSGVAAAVIAGFAIGGSAVLRLLSISLPALQVSGGLLLLLIALELLRPGGGHTSSLADDAGGNVALVPLGTPLLAGPGAIAATIVHMEQAHDAGGKISVFVALAAVLLVTYLALRGSSRLARILRDSGIDLLSRLMGLMVAAIAVQLAASGIQEWINNGVH